MKLKMDIIRKSKPCSASSPMTKVTSNPDRVDAALVRAPEYSLYHFGATRRCIGAIIEDTAVYIRVERILEPEKSKLFREGADIH